MNFVILRFGWIFIYLHKINHSISIYVSILNIFMDSESRLEELMKQIVIILKRLEVIKVFLVDKESDCFAEIIKIEER